MSSSVSGKFQDHYALLGVDPKSDLAAIRAAHQKLAKIYHPDNPDTGSEEKFESINQALEVLSDADLRATFDKLKGISANEEPRFTGSAFFEALNKSADLRAAVLCLLYDRRRVRPFTPSVSMRQTEAMLHVTNDELNFALWYLKQRSLVASDDKSSLQITVEGMDYLESHPPDAARVLAFVKTKFLVEEKKPAPEGSEGRNAVLKALNRTAQARV